ncbi:MAG TPA: hypothetical protein VFV89_24580, partial [Nocardioides sp.]|uniref:hypothetical protein n=1 Tax=Nocardioides sp. TaxID=35761 RepID=UPI002E34D611
MSELTPLREAIDTLAQRAVPPRFGDLQRRATRRGRRRVALVLATTAAVLAGFALVVNGFGDHGRPSPAAPITPTPGPRSAEADQIIAEGSLTSFAGSGSGMELTVWETCENQSQIDCGHAWRLGEGARTLATGMVSRGDVHMDVETSARGFVLTPAGSDGGPAFLVGADGTTSTLSQSCGDLTWSVPTEPGRFVDAGGPNFAD